MCFRPEREVAVSDLHRRINRAFARHTQQCRRTRAARRRPWARKLLFCGSDAGGERAAAIYSLIGSAKLNDLDPEAYLRYVIERIGEHPIDRVEKLLPWNVAAALHSAEPAQLAA
jgi:hypothetical protein